MTQKYHHAFGPASADSFNAPAWKLGLPLVALVVVLIFLSLLLTGTGIPLLLLGAAFLSGLSWSLRKEVRGFRSKGTPGVDIVRLCGACGGEGGYDGCPGVYNGSDLR
ncbi:hypothetical protein B0T14DRAFT_512887 [Immersiella caudata]|uniref:Uncharacterized protein n=1 Tax=Immersiella caudata TaxID=314043 RepID=A0AA39X595_9PEZI|nr:hypothetical protein B0T14DRAFT_512887 [Immersiella caudata]